MILYRQTEQSKKKFENATRIQLANKELNSIEQKFKKFKSKSRQNTGRQQQQSRLRQDDRNYPYNSFQQNQSSFVPDLKQYFTFMMEKENQPAVNNIIEENSYQQQTHYQKSAHKSQGTQVQDKSSYLNKRTIEQKLSEQKSQAITNLENFFATKKSQLQAKISQLQQTKSKTHQDINLLKRNNSELQNQIQLEKATIYHDSTENLRQKNKQIQEKIQRKKQSIQNVKMEVEKTKRRKEELRKNINECLKGNKNFIFQERLNSDN